MKFKIIIMFKLILMVIRINIKKLKIIIYNKNHKNNNKHHNKIINRYHLKIKPSYNNHNHNYNFINQNFKTHSNNNINHLKNVFLKMSNWTQYYSILSV